jgi:hypothetical protein
MSGLADVAEDASRGDSGLLASELGFGRYHIGSRSVCSLELSTETERMRNP